MGHWGHCNKYFTPWHPLAFFIISKANTLLAWMAAASKVSKELLSIQCKAIFLTSSPLSCTFTTGATSVYWLHCVSSIEPTAATHPDSLTAPINLLTANGVWKQVHSNIHNLQDSHHPDLEIYLTFLSLSV